MRLSQIICVVILLSRGFSMTTNSTSKLGPCTRVCGINEKSFLRPYPQLPRSTILLPKEKPKRCAQNMFRSWRRLALRFMRGIGRNDTFPCAQHIVEEVPEQFTKQLRDWDVLWRPNQYLSKYGKLLINGTEGNNVRVIRRNNPVESKCRVHVARAIYRVQTNGTVNRTMFDTKWIIRIPKQGSLFVLVDNKTREIEKFYIRKKDRRKCMKNLTCPSSKTLRFTRVQNKLSMFLRLRLNQMPGVTKTLNLLKEKQDRLESVEEDVSISNLAILCLPLLMSIPPISLLETVSTVAIIAYVVATDILSVFPLLIKGIELLVSSKKNSNAEAFGMLSLTGKQYGIFERFYVQCESNRPQRYSIAIGCMGTAIWFMCASTLTEFLFWRAAKRRKYTSLTTGIPVIGGIPVSHCRTCGSCSYNVDNTVNIMGPAFEMDRNMEQEESFITRAEMKKQIRGTFWNGRRKFVLLLMLPLAVIYFCAIILRFIPLHYGVAFFLFIFHIYTTERQLQLATLFGIIVGFVGGPIYLLFHCSTRVRESDAWGRIATGCNMGAALVAMTFYIIFTKQNKLRMPPPILFTWIYAACVVIVHLVRSKRDDRYLWDTAILSFGLGMLFGPFGGLFMPVFKNSEIDPRVKAQVYLGCGFGFIFTITLITATLVMLGPNLQRGRI